MASSTPTNQLGVDAPVPPARDDAAGTSAPVDALPRRLGFWSTTALVAGVIIGSGIFRVSGGVANDAGSVGGVVTVWVLGGIITLCGVLSLACVPRRSPRRTRRSGSSARSACVSSRRA